MGNRALNYWLIVPILAAALWAAGCSKAGEKVPARTFSSAVAFNVYAVTGQAGSWSGHLVGITPAKQPMTIPSCHWWYVEPLRPVDMERVRDDADAQGILGLRLDDAMDEDLGHLKGMTGLEYLDLRGTPVTDAGLEDLKGATGLEYLDLWGTQVTGDGLEYLKGATRLQYLNLRGTPVTDAGLGHLKGLTALQQLSLGRTHVTDAGLVHLQGLTALRSLDLSYTKVTDAGVRQLKKSLPKLAVERGGRGP